MCNHGRAELLARLLQYVMQPGETILLMSMIPDGEDVECDVITFSNGESQVSPADVADAVCELAAAMARALIEIRGEL